MKRKIFRVATLAVALVMVSLIGAYAQEAVEQGVVINGVRWANCNVDAPGTFAAKPEDAGKFYQWNRKYEYPTTGEKLSYWDTSTSNYRVDFWLEANDPSPAGWRVPDNGHINRLLDTTKVRSEWATQNGVTGRKFTDKSTGNSIFLPAVGEREESDGTLDYAGRRGCYWSSSRFSDLLQYMVFGTNSAIRNNGGSRTYGRSVRSVKK